MRRRYRFNEKTQQLEELGADYVEPTEGGHRSEEEVFGHLQATDGTDLSTRRRHREYMRRHNLTLADDFKETWAKATAEREAYFKGERVDPGHREAVGRAEYELSKRRRR